MKTMLRGLTPGLWASALGATTGRPDVAVGVPAGCATAAAVRMVEQTATHSAPSTR
jgi:hypothetical protein